MRTKFVLTIEGVGPGGPEETHGLVREVLQFLRQKAVVLGKVESNVSGGSAVAVGADCRGYTCDPQLRQVVVEGIKEVFVSSSQEEMAKALGLAQGTISNVFADKKFSRGTARRILSALEALPHPPQAAVTALKAMFGQME